MRSENCQAVPSISSQILTETPQLPHFSNSSIALSKFPEEFMQQQSQNECEMLTSSQFPKQNSTLLKNPPILYINSNNTDETQTLNLQDQQESYPNSISTQDIEYQKNNDCNENNDNKTNTILPPNNLNLVKQNKSSKQQSQNIKKKHSITSYDPQKLEALQKLILQIVENYNINQQNLIEYRKNLEITSPSLVKVYDLLYEKFRKLKKTKEEQIKFCMRKAFKDLFSEKKEEIDLKNYKEANDLCMKTYFSEMKDVQKFVLPFRRDAKIKTMNAQFLKKVFSSPNFRKNKFDSLVKDDNINKIKLLSQTLYMLIQDNKQNDISSLRRLPWTQQLLNDTKKTGTKLPIDYYPDNSDLNSLPNYVPVEPDNNIQKPGFNYTNSTCSTPKLSSLHEIQLIKKNSEDFDNLPLNGKRKRNIILISPKLKTLDSSTTEVDSKDEIKEQKLENMDGDDDEILIKKVHINTQQQQYFNLDNSAVEQIQLQQLQNICHQMPDFFIPNQPVISWEFQQLQQQHQQFELLQQFSQVQNQMFGQLLLNQQQQHQQQLL